MANYFVYQGVKAKFMEKYSLGTMGEPQRKLALHAGPTGLITRGVAFAIIGGFTLTSAVRGTANGEIAGISDALAAIASQTYGKVLIGITGFGLICSAVHMSRVGMYRRFNIGD